MEKLHEKARILFFIQYVFIFIVMSVIVPVFLVNSIGLNNIAVIIYLYFFVLIGVVIFIWFWTGLTYKNWGYELRKDSIYIQRGVIWKHYSSVPYERVQNIDITRGIIARIFGFSSLIIQTAGYSMQGSPNAEGSIPALDSKKAEEYREKILKLIKSKKQGL